MEWALATIALALIAVASVSKRLSGSPITPAILFVSIGILVGPRVIDGIDLSSTSSTVTSFRWSISTRAGSMTDSRTRSRLRLVPVILSRCGVCTRAGSSCSIASASCRAKASSSAGVSES